MWERPPPPLWEPSWVGEWCSEATAVSRKAAVCAASEVTAASAAVSTPRQRSTSDAAKSAAGAAGHREAAAAAAMGGRGGESRCSSDLATSRSNVALLPRHRGSCCWSPRSTSTRGQRRAPTHLGSCQSAGARSWPARSAGRNPRPPPPRRGSAGTPSSWWSTAARPPTPTPLPRPAFRLPPSPAHPGCSPAGEGRHKRRQTGHFSGTPEKEIDDKDCRGLALATRSVSFSATSQAAICLLPCPPQPLTCTISE